MLTHEQRIQRSHIQLMRSPKFALLSGIMLMGESTPVDNFPTAYTNGRDKRYGRAFMDKLSEKELNFVVAHENFHVLFKHMTTWQRLWEEDSRLANMACDYVINQQIVDLDPTNEVVSVPEKTGILLDEKFRGWDSKQVFEYLKQNPSEQPKGGDSMDEHGWEDAKAMSPDEKKELEKTVEAAIRQGSILAGKLKGTTARAIGALPEPKVNWREQLRDFVQSVTAGRDASTWRKPSRRWLAQNMYMPSAYAESIGSAVIAIDTSGSISQSDIAMFLAEIKLITETMPPERIHLLYWDTKIAREETYQPSEYASLAQSTKPAGGGGTDPTCVQQHVQNMTTPPEFVLMLSDGYVSRWPNFMVPTLWAMTTDQIAPNAININLN